MAASRAKPYTVVMVRRHNFHQGKIVDGNSVTGGAFIARIEAYSYDGAVKAARVAARDHDLTEWHIHGKSTGFKTVPALTSYEIESVVYGYMPIYRISNLPEAAS